MATHETFTYYVYHTVMSRTGMNPHNMIKKGINVKEEKVGLAELTRGETDMTSKKTLSRGLVKRKRD